MDWRRGRERYSDRRGPHAKGIIDRYKCYSMQGSAESRPKSRARGIPSSSRWNKVALDSTTARHSKLHMQNANNRSENSGSSALHPIKLHQYYISPNRYPTLLTHVPWFHLQLVPKSSFNLHLRRTIHTRVLSALNLGVLAAEVPPGGGRGDDDADRGGEVDAECEEVAGGILFVSGKVGPSGVRRLTV